MISLTLEVHIGLVTQPFDWLSFVQLKTGKQ